MAIRQHFFTLEGNFLELWLRFKVCVFVCLKTLVLLEIYRSSLYNKSNSNSLLLYWGGYIIIYAEFLQRWAKFQRSDPLIPRSSYCISRDFFTSFRSDTIALSLQTDNTIATSFEINVQSKALLSLHSSKLADFKAIYSFYRLNMFVERNCYASSLQNGGF